MDRLPPFDRPQDIQGQHTLDLSCCPSRAGERFYTQKKTGLPVQPTHRCRDSSHTSLLTGMHYSIGFSNTPNGLARGLILLLGDDLIRNTAFIKPRYVELR